MSQSARRKIIEMNQQIESLQAELAECQKANQKLILDYLSLEGQSWDMAKERDALAAIVVRQGEALKGVWVDGYCFCGLEGFISEQKVVE